MGVGRGTGEGWKGQRGSACAGPSRYNGKPWNDFM